MTVVLEDDDFVGDALHGREMVEEERKAATKEGIEGDALL